MLVLGRGHVVHHISRCIIQRTGARCISTTHRFLRDARIADVGSRREKKGDGPVIEKPGGGLKNTGDFRLDQYGRVIEDEYALLRDDYSGFIRLLAIHNI